MVRKIDYESRRKAILATTINRYIKKAIPIASEEIAKDFNLSSATIRNILAELEDTGYLTHPHASAGRIPTNKGYRYYVDFLILRMRLLDKEKERILREYEKEINHLEDLLEKTSEIVSMITHNASIVSFYDWQDRFYYKGVDFILEQPEFKDLGKIRALIKMIEDKGRLLDIINQHFDEKLKVYIGDELGCPEMDNCSLVVSNYCLKNKPKGKIAVLGPMRMEYSHIIPTLEYISDVLADILTKI